MLKCLTCGCMMCLSCSSSTTVLCFCVFFFLRLLVSPPAVAASTGEDLELDLEDFLRLPVSPATIRLPALCWDTRLRVSGAGESFRRESAGLLKGTEKKTQCDVTRTGTEAACCAKRTHALLPEQLGLPLVERLLLLLLLLVLPAVVLQAPPLQLPGLHMEAPGALWS